MRRGTQPDTFDLEHACAMNDRDKRLGRNLPFPWAEEGLARAARLPHEEFCFVIRIQQPTGDCEAMLEALCIDEEAVPDSLID